MHVRPNQINPYAQLDAMYAAQKAAAKREAERTRKKLLEFASALAGEADFEACIVKLGGREGPAEESNRRSQPKPRNRKEQEEDAVSEDAEISISDWA